MICIMCSSCLASVTSVTSLASQPGAQGELMQSEVSSVLHQLLIADGLTWARTLRRKILEMIPQ